MIQMAAFVVKNQVGNKRKGFINSLVDTGIVLLAYINSKK